MIRSLPKTSGVASPASTHRWTVVLRIEGSCKAAFDLSIKNGNVYLNYHYKDAAHLSMHASGQLHFKKGGEYVKWTGGSTGYWEPMRLSLSSPTQVTQREELGATGWEFSQFLLLPDCSPDGTDVVVCDVPEFDRKSQIIAIQTSVISPNAESRDNIVGYPIVWRTRLTSGMTIELEAFIVS